MPRKTAFHADTCEKLVPDADLVLNLTPDKQHAQVLEQVLPLLQKTRLPVLFPRLQYCGAGAANSG